MRRRWLAPVGVAGVVALAAVGVGVAGQRGGDSGESPVETYVEIAVPKPPGKPKPDLDEKQCNTGCSLAKHHVAPFTEDMFHAAIADYATRAPEEVSESLEQLLFYGVRTEVLLEEHGTGALSPEHVDFLSRQLARRHGVVEIRMVDALGKVRAHYGPQRVPFGVKQHLQAVEYDVQPMEFNGTVMRVGLDYVWSRY